MSVKLHDPVEFDRRFIEATATSNTYEEAYNKVEEEHKKTFGVTKYANYESYRKARARRIKDQRFVQKQ